MRRVSRVLFTAILLLFVLDPAAAQPRRVLLLHSFGPHFAPWSFVSGHFREALIRQSPDVIDLFEASLQSARFMQFDDHAPVLNICVVSSLGENWTWLSQWVRLLLVLSSTIGHNSSRPRHCSLQGRINALSVTYR